MYDRERGRGGRVHSLEEVVLVKDAGDLHENGFGDGGTVQEHQTVDTGVATGLGQFAVPDGEREGADLLDISLWHLLRL